MPIDHQSPFLARRRSASWPALYVLGFFLCVGVLAWAIDGDPAQAVFFALIGLSVGAGFLIHARARPFHKRRGRKISLALVGLSLFFGAGVFGRQSLQIEGFFFYALAGVLGGVVTHYLVAKIVGPLFIGRGWCGWGCWIWMVLDYLPFRRSPGRHHGWARVRVAHFILSLGLVVLLVLLGYDHGFTWDSSDGLWWFLGGCAVYCLLGISLAFALEDNRAFCKYVCPVTVFLRAGNRLALLKVRGDLASCNECGACDKVCPMDIPILSFVKAGTRVLDPECTLCQTCIGACPKGSLALSLGFDVSRASVSAL